MDELQRERERLELKGEIALDREGPESDIYQLGGRGV